MLSFIWRHVTLTVAFSHRHPGPYCPWPLLCSTYWSTWTAYTKRALLWHTFYLELVSLVPVLCHIWLFNLGWGIPSEKHQQLHSCCKQVSCSSACLPFWGESRWGGRENSSIAQLVFWALSQLIVISKVMSACRAAYMLGWEEGIQHFSAPLNQLMWNQRSKDFIGKPAPCTSSKSPNLLDMAPSVLQICVQALITSPFHTHNCLSKGMWRGCHEKTCCAIYNGFAVPKQAVQWLEQRQLMTKGWVVQQQQTPGLTVKFGNCLITCTGTLTSDIRDYGCCETGVRTVSFLRVAFSAWKKITQICVTLSKFLLSLFWSYGLYSMQPLSQL